MRDDGVGVSGTISFWPLVIGEEGHSALLLGRWRFTRSGRIWGSAWR